MLFVLCYLSSHVLNVLCRPPFWANCSVQKCYLIAPGNLPDNSANPPAPSPSKQCPRPPLPTAGNCTYRNNTMFSGVAHQKKINIPLNDYSRCCLACCQDESCQAAAITHGPESAPYDFCWLYALDPQVRAGDSECPNLSVTLSPK